MKKLYLIVGIFVFSGFFISCTLSPEAMDRFISQALSQHLITEEQARILHDVVYTFQVESKPFTLEEERAIGRVVTAAVFSKYPPLYQTTLSEYINKIGIGLAYFSDRSVLAEQCRIAILDSPEQFAISAPGGYILISRGLLRLVESEDMLAALLAHEFSHSALGHGLASLTSVRMGELAMYYAAISGSLYENNGEQSAALLKAAIEDFISLIAIQGYSYVMEYEADASAVRMLAQAGYNPRALEDFIRILATSSEDELQGYSRQHPLPEDRLARIDSYIAEMQDVMANPDSASVFNSKIAEIRRERFARMKELF